MRSWLGDPEAKGLLFLGACLAAWQFGPSALAEVRNVAASFPLTELNLFQKQQTAMPGGLNMDDSGSPDLVFFDQISGCDVAVWEAAAFPWDGIPADGMLMDGCDW